MALMKLVAATVLATFVLAGCAAQALPQVQKKDAEVDAWKQTLPVLSGDYGSYPTNYEELAKAHLATTLKDPESARFGVFSKPRKEHVITNVDAKEATYGYSTCVSVNAKNSYGGYTGNHQFWFFIRNGKVLRSQDVDSGPFGRTIYRGRSVNCQDGGPV